MKVFGIVFILLGTIGLGLRYGWELEFTFKERKDLLDLIGFLKKEIRFGYSSLPECFKRLGERKENPFCVMSQQVYEEIIKNQGDNLYSILKEKFKVGGDGEIFYSCFQNASEDIQGILNALEKVEEELSKKNQQLEVELRDRKKLGISLGTVGGIILVIVLL